ncbi:hypothetical protein BGX26_008088, partial [Mortierella sp. AD094]
ATLSNRSSHIFDRPGNYNRIASIEAFSFVFHSRRQLPTAVEEERNHRQDIDDNYGQASRPSQPFVNETPIPRVKFWVTDEGEDNIDGPQDFDHNYGHVSKSPSAFVDDVPSPPRRKRRLIVEEESDHESLQDCNDTYRPASRSSLTFDDDPRIPPCRRRRIIDERESDQESALDFSHNYRRAPRSPSSHIDEVAAQDQQDFLVGDVIDDAIAIDAPNDPRPPGPRMSILYSQDHFDVDEAHRDI